MTQAIIFSKDRPAQLDLLLRSMERYAPQLWPPTIVYTHSNAAFGAGYWLLCNKHESGPVWLWENGTFKTTLMDGWRQDKPHTMFLVDDNVFFRPMPKIPELVPMHAYATRLGKNLTHCWNVDRPQVEGILDYDATCILDGAVYRTADIQSRIGGYEFNNPNDLEGKFCEGEQFKLLYADEPCLIGIPHNIVSASSSNRNMGGSAAELNERFLHGERLSLDMDFSVARGCHWPLEFVWEKR